MLGRVEEEVRYRVNLPPKDDLDPMAHDEVSKHIKGLKSGKHQVGTPSAKALKCFSAPLTGQYVLVNETYQSWSTSLHALPVLYSAYINDIPRPSAGVQLALFADDTALYLRSNSIGNILQRLQRAIDELTQWLRLWRIDVNPDKSASIYFNYNTKCRINSVEEQLTHHGTSKLCTSPGPPISKYMKDASERFFDVVSNHPNPLLVEAVSYEPPPHIISEDHGMS
ncbi:RNA-directed DNA polymerase from mobile element jockey [Eumeta japonica]|uniref:RNA-directed DNA polymerase from mobile element jockey n=1 Tax=Eumeta variegata TaxID=151549 RepID=A0A4C2AGE5_EUMVA|nr:RNA-directed DNA polymerase from mobile element jockey [Eumeta japonica]